MKKKRFVAYYRVSTGKQSKEMPAQKTAVKNYLKKSWPPEKSFTEIESGAKNDRPELKKALDYCHERDATLVVAKLDRLSRDLEFIGWLQNTDINFVCCDMPEATRETIGFMAVIARWEREQIAKRTKEALAEKRKEGVLLGSHNPRVRRGLDRYRKRMAIKRKRAERANKAAKPAKVKAPEKPKPPSAREIADKGVMPIIRTLRAQGYSYQDVATALNEGDIPTRQGGKWAQTSVVRIVHRNPGK